MRSLALRAAVALSAAVALLSGASRVVSADDEAAPFRASDVKLTDAAMPEGWKLAADDVAAADTKPVTDAIAQIAKDAGDVKVDVAAQSAATADGLKAVIVFVEVAAKSDAFTKAVTDAGATKGWDAKPLGFPTRLVVVSSPSDIRAKAVDAAVLGAARALTAKAKSGLEKAVASHDFDASEKAQTVLKAALAVDPKFAPAHQLAGRLALDQFAAAHGADADAIDTGIAHFRAALAKDATGSLTAEERTTAQGQLGGFLLQKGGPSTEARDLLKEAVAGAANVKRDQGLEYRYNLACAHGRLKEVDEAYKHLAVVLEENAKSIVPGIHWLDDEDFDNLHSDPRWEEFKKKYPQTTHSTGDGLWR